jgi:hypothetical protein
MEITESFHESLYGEVRVAQIGNPIEFEGIDGDSY